MSTLAHQSADFPGHPSVRLEVPDRWEPAHAPGTAGSLVQPTGVVGGASAEADHELVRDVLTTVRVTARGADA